MRPLRFLLTVSTSIIAFFFLIFVGPWRSPTQQDIQSRGTIRTYFNWHPPSSLFPPSAIISLTDDNSTFFLARPAAFGPVLPVKSLSGQLWIGSGFGEDHIGRAGSGAEGELGCSDVPGWNDGNYRAGLGSGRKFYSDARLAAGEGRSGSGSGGGGSSSRKRSSATDAGDKKPKGAKSPTEDDGTDDYLHHPLPASDGLKTNGDSMGSTKKPTHADIQSLQEGAEIAGKIVLLSRGGCGFLEKVKWVQRRGGIALIVGDDVRGGQLVTMYARGDTSNVTIPSLFTSHTTAHLLSSLVPAGRRSGDLFSDVERLGFALADLTDQPGGTKPKAAVEKPNFTTTTASTTRPTSTPKAKMIGTSDSREPTKHEDAAPVAQPHAGWFWYIFGNGGQGNSREDSRRPPSSGNIGWVLQENFEDDLVVKTKSGKQDGMPHTNKKLPAPGDTDDFVIGVQDWRDPDLVAQQREQLYLKTASSSSSAPPASKSSQPASALKGGSITPGSGEYIKSEHSVHDLPNSGKAQSKSAKAEASLPQQHGGSAGWLSRLFRGKTHDDTSGGSQKASIKSEHAAAALPRARAAHHATRPLHADQSPHEGLWVTLTPTSVSSSPFFDTLLVLVVSPLVTLTVVYALLLLRSRIRRRRWRAPKSIVERLPVRTYHTMSSASSSSTASSTASPITSTTPLLPQTSRPIDARSRPRARTASAVPHSSSLRTDTLASSSLDQIEEKRASGLAEWRRRYGGKQRECVVCLEEYVDGVSRVMSLPCGHEFHAECITPWLTTRRRTCPICKGDVVRSMARSSAGGGGTGAASSLSSRPPHLPRSDSDRDDGLLLDDDANESNDLRPHDRHHSRERHRDADDVTEGMSDAETSDPSSASAASRLLPVSREDEAFEDLERGMVVDRTR